MNAKREATIWGLEVGIMIGLVFVFVAGYATGGGHGGYLPAVLLFPYSMLSVTLFLIEGIQLPFLLIGLAQFPVYGVLLGRHCVNLRKIAIAHGVAVVLNLLGYLLQSIMGHDNVFPLF